MPKFDFLEALTEDGAKIDAEWDTIEDDRFYYRIRDNLVEVGIKAEFNKWGDSVDFNFSVPKTRRAYEKRMACIDKAMENRHPYRYRRKPDEHKTLVRPTPRRRRRAVGIPS